MTANNLSEHLTWLLRTKPCIPVDNQLYRPVADQNDLDSADSSSSRATDQQKTANPPTETLPRPEPGHRSTQSVHISTQPPHPPTSGASAIAPLAPMARLQATISARPSNMLTAVSSSVVRQRATRPDTANVGDRASARTPVPTRAQFNAGNPPETDRARKIEYLDLTEDMPNRVASPGVSRTAARKRKSEELDQLGETTAAAVQPPRTRTRPALTIANSSDSDGNADVLDTHAHVQSPPPPYSTTVPRTVDPLQDIALPNANLSDPALPVPEFPVLNAVEPSETLSKSTNPSKDAWPLPSSDSKTPINMSVDDATLLQKFMSWTEAHLKSCIDTCEKNIEHHTELYVSALDQDTETTGHMAAVESARAQSDALANMRLHKDNLLVLELQKQGNLQSITKAVRTGASQEAGLASLARTKADLQQAKALCVPFLRVLAPLLKDVAFKRPMQPEPKLTTTSPNPADGRMQQQSRSLPLQACQAKGLSRARSDQPPDAVNNTRPSTTDVLPRPRLREHSSTAASITPRTRPTSGIDKENRPITIPDDVDDLSEDDNLFDTVMGTPPAQAGDEDAYDDDFGCDNDDHLFDLVDKISTSRPAQRPPVQPHSQLPKSRTVFAEISGNTAKTQTQFADTQSHSADFSHAWSSDVKRALKERFRLVGFRSNQLNAINATLAGKDVFVLMPTGGGKSLCYQLPAIIDSGTTKGVTVVISPLLSLMEDQVEHLSALGINAAVINGKTSAPEKRHIFDSFWSADPGEAVSILYVTPEMLTKNQRMISAFERLHARGRFARIVIDEAHCVSQWGHDFRPDYTQIGDIKSQFQGLPLMALTATATENVKLDVINNLSIRGCEVYTQSFNRPNLFYEVRVKDKGSPLLDDIAAIIKSREYSRRCGIIYCLSRKKCESVAQALKNTYKIKAEFYHAGLEAEEKSRKQRAWQQGKFHVIVATIAFGMGIDKPDVRYVIHHSIPSSLEGYYQETGRAGRDSKRSGCYLFYSYGDTAFMNDMIEKSEGSYEQKERKRAMLRNMVAYCENRSVCRRVQVLNYFGEQFPKRMCKAECDNCTSTAAFDTQDFTAEAKAAVNLVETLNGKKQNVTLLRCVDVLRGVGGKVNAPFKDYASFGSAGQHNRSVLERLVYQLVSMGALEEERHTNKAGFNVSYMRLGGQYRQVLRSTHKVTMDVRISPDAGEARIGTVVAGPSKGKRKAPLGQDTVTAKARRAAPLSTNVSSPVQGRGLQHRKGSKAVSNLADDFGGSDDEYGDEFESMRTTGPRKVAQKRNVGPPITVDQRMEALNEVHRDIVDTFVNEAKQECQTILKAKSLKAWPFSESHLREMAISFPTTIEEMAQLPGFDTVRVKLYGKRFVNMLNPYRESYEEMMGQPDAEVVQDPNHEVVINLCSDVEDEDSMNYVRGVESDDEVDGAENGHKAGAHDDDDDDDEDEYGSLDGDIEEHFTENSMYFQNDFGTAGQGSRNKSGSSKSGTGPARSGAGSKSKTFGARKPRAPAKRKSGGGDRSSTGRRASGGAGRGGFAVRGGGGSGRVSKSKAGAPRRSSDKNGSASAKISSFLYNNSQGGGTGASRGGIGIGMMPT